MIKRKFPIKRKLPNIYFYFPAFALIIYLIIRLINQSQIIWTFPLDYTNDWSSHIAQLYFLAKIGFHNLNPYWYNGYILFKFYSPGWFFFTLPIYLLTKNILFSAYSSMLLLLFIGFLVTNFFLKILNLSLIKRMFFYTFFFANPISIGNFIRLGKVTELIGWILFLSLAFIILMYKDRPLDFKILSIFTLLTFILIISHPIVLMVFLLFILSLFLIKNLKEKILIIISLIISAILSSFWLVPFLKDLSSSSTLVHEQTSTLLSFSGPWLKTTIAIITMIIAFWIIFIFYIKQAKNKKRELIFYSPLLIISVLVLSKLIMFIPFLKNIYPDVYSLLFLFNTLYLFLKIKYDLGIRRLISCLLVILSLLFILLSSILTPWFTHYTDIEHQTLSLLPNLDDKFIIISHPKTAPTSYSAAYNSYVPIYYNISTSDGWGYTEIDPRYLTLLDQTYLSFKNRDCIMFKSYLQKLNTTNVIGYLEDCDTLKECSFKEIISTESVCLKKLI